MSTARWLVVGILALVVGTAAWGQEAREPQTGVKTTEPGYVTSLEVDVPVNDPDQAGRVVGESFELLWDATAAAGFTPTGKARAIGQVSMDGRPGDTVRFALQLYIMEQPTAEDLNAEFDFQLLPAPAEKVAYTYHKGPLGEADQTLMRLWQWTIGQDLDVAGYPYMVVYGDTAQAPEVIEVQLPVK